MLEPILAAEYPFEEVFDDDLRYVEDLGLIGAGDEGLEIANPIYHEVILRVLAAVTQRFIQLARGAYVAEDRGLLFTELMDGFVGFWRRHAEHFLGRPPYSEEAAQLIFMAFLQKIVNGAPPLPERISREQIEHRGRRLTVQRL